MAALQNQGLLLVARVHEFLKFLAGLGGVFDLGIGEGSVDQDALLCVQQDAVELGGRDGHLP